MPRVYNPKDGKIRNMLIKMGWTVGSAITFAQGHAVIAKGHVSQAATRSGPPRTASAFPACSPDSKQ
jgi:hypothetical protein